MIIPSIDLMNGKAVQLRQGKEKALEREDVLDLALEFRKYGEIAVIDLDAALGKGNNLEIIKKICKIADCRVGGGIRTVDKAKELVRAGAKKIIIGSAAFKDEKVDVLFLKILNKNIGRDKIIIAIDSREGKIVIKGWKESTLINPLRIVKDLEPYCSEFLYTYVDKEGMMEGTDFSTLRKLKFATTNEITAAGGISSMDEINRLERLGVNSVLGMALYTGKIKLP